MLWTFGTSSKTWQKSYVNSQAAAWCRNKIDPNLIGTMRKKDRARWIARATIIAMARFALDPSGAYQWLYTWTFSCYSALNSYQASGTGHTDFSPSYSSSMDPFCSSRSCWWVWLLVSVALFWFLGCFTVSRSFYSGRFNKALVAHPICSWKYKPL